MQLTEIELGIISDIDAGLARQTRERIGAELEGRPQTIAAGGHFANSVFGRVVPALGKRWVSVAGHGRG